MNAELEAAAMDAAQWSPAWNGCLFYLTETFVARASGKERTFGVTVFEGESDTVVGGLHFAELEDVLDYIRHGERDRQQEKDGEA